MALIKRTELPAALAQGTIPLNSPVFLFFGERFLCREAADMLQEKLLAARPGAVQAIDGDSEDPARTLSRLMSFSLLPGLQLFRVTDSRLFHSKTVIEEIWNNARAAIAGNNPDLAGRQLRAMAQAAGLTVEGPAALSELPAPEWYKLFGFNKPSEELQWADRLLEGGGLEQKATSALADRYIEAMEKGFPDRNLLLLTAESVDKRHRLFSYLKKKAVVVDCSVTVGGGTAAQNEQKEILREVMGKTLKRFGKKMEPRAVELFFERVGFHPVAVAVETEKLAHFVGDQGTIPAEAVEEMVGRTREDALYELTDALSKRQAERTLTVLAHLLEQGVHELAILSTLRNYLRKQLVFRALQLRPHPPWRSTMSAQEFQNSYLPALKAEGEWGELLQGHPYALFMSFTKASEYSCAGLKRWMAMLLEAEFRLKGAPLPSRLVLEEMLLAMIKGGPKLAASKSAML